ncbi:TBC1 domain family member 2B-like isoform X4 [Lineus longissimus]|uniref:TBC1 domain family member 2B-like isoform X4 n=1 Tax=Lineus longissimus TaxID=88925 RepID=UPI00315CBE1E
MELEENFIESDETIGDNSPINSTPSEPSSHSSFEVIQEGENASHDKKSGAGSETAAPKDGTPAPTFPLPEEKLCGYLSKLGNRGLVKSYKLRWFVYGENTCKLYYYRTPQDVLPLGEIDISNAVFPFEALNMEKPGFFQIRNIERTYYLDAGDKQTMMYWLQELQKRRRQHSLRQTVISEETITTKQIKVAESGLVQPLNLKTMTVSPDGDCMLLNPVDSSTVMVGQKSASSRRGSAGLSNVSWSNWKIELRNTFTQFKATTGKPAAEKQSFQGYLDAPISSSPGSSQTDISTPASNTAKAKLGSSQTDISTPASNIATTMSGSSQTDISTPVSSIATAQSGSSQTDISAPIPETAKSKSISFATPQSTISKDSKFSALKRMMSRTKSTSDETVESSCNRCKQLDLTIATLKDELAGVEEELEAHKDIVRLLQKQVDVKQRELSTEAEFRHSVTDLKDLEQLKVKDKMIVDLEHLMTTTKEEMAMITHRIRKLESENKSMKEQISMYQESLQAKDEVVRSLTHQLAAYEQGNFNENTTDSAMNTTLTTMAGLHFEEIERNKEVCEAYELQNKLLSKEILELNMLRADDERRAKMLLVQCAKNEANYYSIQSKYLLLLNQLSPPKMGTEGSENQSEELVTRLLEDAMESDVHTKADGLEDSSRSNFEYDKYGFCKTALLDEEENHLVARARRLQKDSEDITSTIQGSDYLTSLRVKWENYFVNLGTRELQPCVDLKILIRQGIPYDMKEKVWKAVINFRVGKMREIVGPSYYCDLLSTKGGIKRYNPAAKQIELDLLRTLPNNKHYESLQGEGIPRLRRILQAYSCHNPVVGYCQGLNRLVAIALLFLNEEDAFWCLVCIVDFIMPQDYYSKTLIASQADQRVLKDLISEKLPRFYAHLDSYEVDMSLFTFNWFLTVFVDNIPVETFLRIWDDFLYEGTKVLFRFAIAFFKYAEEDILALKDHMAIHKYLRVLGETMLDCRRLSQIAFHDLNPFPMKSINTKRSYYLLQVKHELEELDAIREDFKNREIPSDRREFWSDDDLD